jgi:hypothetical protein
MFFRGEEARTRAEDGMGIGQHLCGSAAGRSARGATKLRFRAECFLSRRARPACGRPL